MTNSNTSIQVRFVKTEVFLTKEANGSIFKRSFHRTVVRLLATRNSNGISLNHKNLDGFINLGFFLSLLFIMDVILVISPSHLDSYLVIESKRSEMSIVLFFVGIFSKEGLSLVEIAVAIGVSTTVISLQNVTIRPATCRNMSEPLINCVIKNSIKSIIWLTPALLVIGTVCKESCLIILNDDIIVPIHISE